MSQHRLVADPALLATDSSGHDSPLQSPTQTAASDPTAHSKIPHSIASERDSPSSPLSDPVLSPPNQPRRSLSMQLAPDYHDWVNDVSSPPSQPPPTSHTGNRFLDAVTGRSKAQQGRARRANQPSFTGSAFTNSDNEGVKDPDDGGDDGDKFQEGSQAQVHARNRNTDQGNDADDVSRQNLEPSSIDRSSLNSHAGPTPRLPPLSKSRVQVQDPSRPTFKLGTPIAPKSRSPKNHASRKSDVMDPSIGNPGQSSERSALLGASNQSKNPHREGEDRWTNEGSRRRTPRYNGPAHLGDHDGSLGDMEDASDDDSLRRPSRARSLSPTMESRLRESRNRGRILFRNYPGPGQNGRRSQPPNLRRSSMAMVKEKLLSRRSAYYDDAKEALVKENNGIRIWYHNYTTIDWIHDFVKERVRLRHLRSQGGIRGMLKNRADSMKGWILVLLTADPCPEWVSWSKALSTDSLSAHVSNDTFDWIVYCCFGTLFAAVCVVMVTSDGTVSQQRSHGATKRRSAVNSSGISISTSRTSMESILYASQPKKIAYFGAGSGIPEVKTILGGFVIRGFLGFRTLMIKLIGLPLMVASGLNMGKQGPLVHIACCVANIVCRIFDKYNRNDGKRREILSAAAASGVAVAFGAPIGGVLFSLEEVSYYFPSKTMWRTYFCALTSAVVLKMINPYRVGKTVLFQVTYDRDWHLFESIPFIFISVLGGVYGAIFSQFHMSYSRFRSRTWIGRRPVLEVLIVTLITCAIQWLNPWTRVNLLQLLTNLYSECTPENNLNGMCATEIDQIYPIFLLLAQVFIMKVALNFITFGVKVPGGIFIPTMVAGAVFGRMVGLGVQWLIAKYPEHQVFQVCEGHSMDCVIPGLYAMIGAAACLSGVTRMTVSLVVIMFELTGAMTYSLPIMMAVMMGKFVGDAFSPDAFFNKLIDLNEHPYLDNKKDYNTFGTAADIADRYLETIDVNALNDVDSLRRKVEILAASGYSDGGLPIVDRGMLVGYIASNELGHALDLAEQKHPECICIFRNRATSNVPATEIMTSLSNLEPPTGGPDREMGLGIGLTASPILEYTPHLSSQARHEWLQNQFRDDTNNDYDIHGDGRLGDASKDSPNQTLRSDNKSFGTNLSQSGYEASLADDESRLAYPDGSRRYAHHSGRISSTGTTHLLRDPAHTMDFTPFTDQAPLAVSLFSSMDLVMELFIKLGIKYICVVKAGEHYGMIHKKRLLSFLKENDEKQKRNSRSRCF
ncbi:hypothetical protein BGZ58_005717 [Dissophora ornata]|nr:hypothetical protein BGZ58_005717 [Dissophora ornata]